MSNIQDNTTLWGCKATSDVTLIIAGREYPSHREILAAHSDYFKRMFHGDFIESDASAVELSEDDADDLESLLRVLYGFPVQTAMDFYMRVPCIADFFSGDMDGKTPLTRGQAVVPKLDEMVGLYVVADKYLCEGVCEELLGGNSLPWALHALMWDYFAGQEEETYRPDAELLGELLMPVYGCLADGRDPLRAAVADAVVDYWQSEPELAGALFALLPDLEADLAMLEMGRLGFDRRKLTRARAFAIVKAMEDLRLDEDADSSE